MGIYSVIAYGVAQRAPASLAFAWRSAPGPPQSVVRMVVQEGLRLTLLGVGLGLLVAFALTRFMQSLLFEVNPADPLWSSAGSRCFLSCGRRHRVLHPRAPRLRRPGRPRCAGPVAAPIPMSALLQP